MKLSLIEHSGNILLNTADEMCRQSNAQRSEKAPVYGFELVLDLKDCDPSSFNRESLDDYFSQLCDLISMEKAEVHFWDDVGVAPEEQQTDAHTKGTSAVCFILTSSIVIHTLDILKTVYVNIFSCKTFAPDIAAEFTKDWFHGKIQNSTFIERH